MVRTKRAYNNSRAGNRKIFPALHSPKSAISELLDLAFLVAFLAAICMVRA
jgi:hypothetical protein